MAYETNIEIGRRGEIIAADFLVNKGFKLIAKNYSKPWGEIDLICEKGGVVRFVEVKSKRVSDFSRERAYEPEALVDDRKLRKVARTASLYMESMRDHREFQIDVVGVLLDTSRRVARCRLYEQVLES